MAVKDGHATKSHLISCPKRSKGTPKKGLTSLLKSYYNIEITLKLCHCLPLPAAACCCLCWSLLLPAAACCCLLLPAAACCLLLPVVVVVRNCPLATIAASCWLLAICISTLRGRMSYSLARSPLRLPGSADLPQSCNYLHMVTW